MMKKKHKIKTIFKVRPLIHSTYPSLFPLLELDEKEARHLLSSLHDVDRTGNITRRCSRRLPDNTTQIINNSDYEKCLAGVH
mmetsp:Transcript_13945/g.22246  ORF Transcript_13945/g.22246 Transcript_13945/m.22246 type:complete len:82 (-) Transcript_13945:1326-1571(-)